MASTLAAQLADLQADISFYLGYPRGAAYGEEEPNDAQSNAVARCVKGGLRKVYHCGYTWSFLKPVASLTLPADTSELLMPPDFGSPEGNITVYLSTGVQWWPVPIVGIGMVYSNQAQLPDTTGRPLMACVEPLKGTSVNESQRWQMRLFPISDQAYTLQFAYNINPDYLTGSNPYPYGGPEHAETFLEACLSVAELILDDKQGVHAAEFARLLTVSMSLDRRNKGQLLGPNADRSDGRTDWRNRWQHYQDTILVDGVQY